MKKLIIIIMLLCSPSFALAAGTCGTAGKTGTSPYTAASASYANVNACVNTHAERGATVIVPNGTETWGSTLAITKGIILQGSGIANTIITSSQSTVISYNPDATARSNPDRFEISGFKFIYTISGYGSGIIHFDSPVGSIVKDVVIHDNYFQSTASFGGKQIATDTTVYGVAYHNTFESGYVGDFLGNDPNWSFPLVYASENQFFFEDNLFYPTSGNPCWIESGDAGQYSMRYNTLDFTGHPSSGEFLDVHGDDDDGAGGAKGGEFYGNLITGGTTSAWMKLRGGKMMWFFNKASGNEDVDITEWRQCAAQTVTDTYFWNSYDSGGLMIPSNSTYFPGECPVANEDYWYQYNETFTGARGVGCGTLANRPAACTEGVGYWATNQACSSSMTDMVGQNPSTPISGTLYKCTVTGNPGTWTSYYTPLTYPHPLREEGTTTPSVTGCTINMGASVK